MHRSRGEGFEHLLWIQFSLPQDMNIVSVEEQILPELKKTNQIFLKLCYNVVLLNQGSS